MSFDIGGPLLPKTSEARHCRGLLLLTSLQSLAIAECLPCRSCHCRGSLLDQQSQPTIGRPGYRITVLLQLTTISLTPSKRPAIVRSDLKMQNKKLGKLQRSRHPCKEPCWYRGLSTERQRQVVIDSLAAMVLRCPYTPDYRLLMPTKRPTIT